MRTCREQRIPTKDLKSQAPLTPRFKLGDVRHRSSIIRLLMILGPFKSTKAIVCNLVNGSKEPKLKGEGLPHKGIKMILKILRKIST